MSARGDNGPEERRRPTMKDVAERVGVHQTTVSLALGGRPGVSEETRRRIREAADQLGYRRDPMLDAFNDHRRIAVSNRMKPIIACIVDESFLLTGPEEGYAQRRLNGVREASREMGLKLEWFILGRDGLTPARMDGVLFARGIEGVIVTGLDYTVRELTLTWDRYVAVCIQSRQLRLRLDTVSTDLRQVARLAMRRLRKLGYRRIGLTTAWEDEDWLARSMTSGYLAESASLPVEDRISPYLFGAGDGPVGDTGLLDWVRANRVDVTISNWNNIPEALEQGGLSVPAEIGFASLDLLPGYRQMAGVIESHEQVGRIAVEHLAILLQARNRGLLEVPATTFVPGSWRDGPSAPGLV